MDIRRTELGLLVVFEALVQECHVTRAGTRVGLSQPATSAALRRLREIAGDPLFLRSGRGLRPTARAIELFGPVHEALSSLRTSFRSPAPFDPATSSRSFTLMLSDIGEVMYSARLIARLRRDAPGIRVLIRRLSAAAVVDELACGTVDVALGYIPGMPGEIMQMPLFEEDFVCAVRRDHPRIGRRLTLERYMAESHLLVARSPSVDEPAARPLDGDVSARLAALGLKRRIAMSMPHFLPAPLAVGSTDLLLTLPRGLGEVFQAHAGLTLLPLPFVVPTFTISMFWHTRFDQEGANSWLRGLIEELFARRHPPAREGGKRSRKVRAVVSHNG